MNKQQPDRPQVLITAKSAAARHQTSTLLPNLLSGSNIICTKDWPETHAWASTIRIDVVVICPHANQGFSQTQTEIERISKLCGKATTVIVYTPKIRERENALVSAYVRQPKINDLVQRIKEFLTKAA